MARFMTALRIEKIGAQQWLLIDNLLYESDILPGIFMVPRGFQTDFASIPRPLWVVFPKVDIYDAAAVLHDAAYGNALMSTPLDDPKGVWERVFMEKRWGDKLFDEALGVCGVKGLQRILMYRMVSLFGDPLGHPLVENRV